MSKKIYNHKEIEKKWQEIWDKTNIYKAEDFSEKPKKYILVEFPYPSGTGLHCGHVMRFTLPDIYSRKLRMSGYNVLFPIGWDAFGLPAENYAVKTGTHPDITTQKAVETFQRQLRELGFGFDWDREINTTDPDYYKWTQWLFLKFFEHRLAELKEESVWWSDDLKTILANEEVIKDEEGNLVAERDGKSRVERRMLKQWVLKIPKYADKLIEGLSKIDFDESIKHAQINWIGRSEGAEVDFTVEDSDQKITIFTTRLDTIFGASFIVVAPEHGILNSIVRDDYQAEVKNYQNISKNKSELDRTSLNKEKTGVFTGSFAINPYSGKKVPIWVSDFVVTTYGTGAIMGVPAHDERDNEFAKKFDLEIIPVVKSEDNSDSEKLFTEKGILINSNEYSGLNSQDAFEKLVEFGEKNNFARKKVNYKIRDWLFSRQRYWGEPIPLIHREDGKIAAICNTENKEEVNKNLPLVLPNVPDYTPSSDATSPLAKNTEWVNITLPDGSKAKRETNTMPNWAGSCWYYLRYIDPKNNNAFADVEKLKYWLPVDKYFGGSEHTTLHLLYSRFWHKFFYDLGVVPTEEPYSWRMNGGILLGPDGQKMSKSKGNVINPDEKVSEYGADALRIYINFMGPYDATITWAEGGLKACRNLVDTVYNLQSKVSDKENNERIIRALHKLNKNVSTMIDNLKANTAVSEFMIFTNLLKQEEFINVEIWKDFLKLFAPFAPFLTEELWQVTNQIEWNEETSIHSQSWPKYDENLAKDDQVTIGVQINGKLRSEIEVSNDETEEKIKDRVLNDENVIKWMEGKEVRKFIYVKGKIVNVVI